MSGGATPSEIRGFFDEAERLAAKAREVKEGYASIAKRAKDKEIAWTQLKALATAHDADKHPPEGKKSNKVGKLVASREYACWYAEILRLGQDEQVIAMRSSTLTPSPSVPVSSKSPPSARDSDGAAVSASGISDTAATLSESRDGGESRPAVRTHNSHLVGPVSDHARGGGCPAEVALGSRDTNAGREVGEGRIATDSTMRSAPLVATAGDGGGPMGAVATLDDPYNCIPESLRRF